jgi:hypothetical protein
MHSSADQSIASCPGHPGDCVASILHDAVGDAAAFLGSDQCSHNNATRMSPARLPVACPRPCCASAFGLTRGVVAFSGFNACVGNIRSLHQ